MRGSCRPATATTRTSRLLWSLVLLFGLLGASLALFATNPRLRTVYELPELRLVLLSAIVLRRRRSSRSSPASASRSKGAARTSSSAAASSPRPRPRSSSGSRRRSAAGRSGTRDAWAEMLGRLLGAALIAAAAVRARARRSPRPGAVALRRRDGARARRALGRAPRFRGDLVALVVEPGERPPAALVLTLALLALCNLAAVAGFVWRYRNEGEDLDLLARDRVERAPVRGAPPRLHAARDAASRSRRASSSACSRTRVLLVGVWRAIRSAEFGRAVAEERARVAREIHDGLAQYLFAISTSASMLENGADPAKTLPRLKEAAAQAQQEARFAVLALSSASGTAPFDAALRRYVEFLTADGRARRRARHRRGRSGSRPTSRSRSSGSSRKGSRTCASTRARRRAEVRIGQRCRRPVRRRSATTAPGSTARSARPGRG